MRDEEGKRRRQQAERQRNVRETSAEGLVEGHEGRGGGFGDRSHLEVGGGPDGGEKTGEGGRRCQRRPWKVREGGRSYLEVGGGPDGGDDDERERD